jgi:hypothetical protein
MILREFLIDVLLDSFFPNSLAAGAHTIDFNGNITPMNFLSHNSIFHQTHATVI